jgi:uncharacterized iron-regulated membrane protein
MDKAKSIWLAIHGWLGAISAVFILIIALTGSAVIFLDDLMRWQLGSAVSSSTSGEWTLPTTLLDASTKKAGAGFVPLQLYYPNTLIKMPVAMIYGQGGSIAATPEQEVLVFLDPVSGASQGLVKLDEVWADTLLHLHVELLAGTFGSYLVSICGIILLISAISGVYLWWPSRGSIILKLFKPHFVGNWRTKTIIFHHLVGIYFAAVILILGFSGTQISQPQWFSAVLPYQQGELTADNIAERGCGTRQPASKYIDTILAQYPQRTLSIYSPAALHQPAHLRLKAVDDADQFNGDLYAWLDCQGVIKITDFGATGILDAISLMQYSLHSGRSFGAAGAVMVFLAGLALAFLAASGLYLFIKRKLRKAAV